MSDDTDRVIAAGIPAMLRALERARLDCGDVAAMTAHIAVKDGEVLVTVRADGTASAGFEDRRDDITPMLGPALRREQ
jgi:hypothetical protein